MAHNGQIGFFMKRLQIFITLILLMNCKQMNSAQFKARHYLQASEPTHAILQARDQVAQWQDKRENNNKYKMADQKYEQAISLLWILESQQLEQDIQKKLDQHKIDTCHIFKQGDKIVSHYYYLYPTRWEQLMQWIDACLF